MMSRPIRLMSLFLGFLVALFTSMVMATQPGIAQEELESLKKPIVATLMNDLDGNTAKVNDKFKAVLSDELVYEDEILGDTILPKGTLFAGHVAKHKVSKRFGRSGYMILAVDKVTFPNGNAIEFSEEENSRGKKTYHEKVKAKKKYKYITVPLSALSFVTPLGVAYGAKTVVGAAKGLSDDDLQDDSKGKRMLKGAYRASPISTVVGFVKKSPLPVFKKGDAIEIYLPKEAVQELFTASHEIGYRALVDYSSVE